MKLTGKPQNNLVLLKPKMKNDKIFLGNGSHLYLDTQFEPEKHAEIVCDVIQVPDHLIYSEKYGNYVTMPWEIEMEAQPGDVAFCDYLAIRNALINKEDGKAFIIDNEVYFLIHYMNIFMVLREDKPIMCNGYILVEPTYDEYEKVAGEFKKLNLEVPDSAKDLKKYTQFGIVRYIGSRPKRYLNKASVDMDLEVGQKIMFDKFADIPLEYDLHQTFEKGKTIFRILRKDIMMIL